MSIVGKTKIEHTVISVILYGVKGESTVSGELHHSSLGAGRAVTNINKDHLKVEELVNVATLSVILSDGAHWQFL